MQNSSKSIFEYHSWDQSCDCNNCIPSELLSIVISNTSEVPDKMHQNLPWVILKRRFRSYTWPPAKQFTNRKNNWSDMFLDMQLIIFNGVFFFTTFAIKFLSWLQWTRDEKKKCQNAVLPINLPHLTFSFSTVDYTNTFSPYYLFRLNKWQTQLVLANKQILFRLKWKTQ